MIQYMCTKCNDSSRGLVFGTFQYSVYITSPLISIRNVPVLSIHN